MRAGPPVEGWARRVIADRKVAPIAVSPPDRQSAAVRPISPAAPSEGHVGGHAAAGARRKAAASSSARPARSRAVPDPGRTSRGDRAGAGDPVGRHACEAPAARRDQAGDRLRAARPAVAAGNPWLDTGPARPEGAAGAAGRRSPGRLAAWDGGRALEPLAGHADDQAGAGRRAPARSTSTPCGCRCTGSTSSSRAGRRACSARTPAASASWSSACSTTPGGRWCSSWAGWSCWPGSTGGCCSAALCLVPGVYYSDLLWNRRIRPALPRRPQGAAGDRQPDHRGLRRHAGGPRLRPPEDASRPGSWARTTSWPGSGASRLVAVAADRAALGVCSCRWPRSACCSTADSRSSTAGSRWAT